MLGGGSPLRKETINHLPAESTPLGGAARRLVDKPELRLVNLELKPGEVVKSHLAPVEVVFIVLAGSGQVLVENETHSLAAGEMLVCPAGTNRSLRADIDQGLNLLVVRAPNADS